MRVRRACVLSASTGEAEGEMTMGKTDWLRTKPRAAKVARRSQETGRGRERYRLAVWAPRGLEETRRERGDRAKRESSRERK